MKIRIVFAAVALLVAGLLPARGAEAGANAFQDVLGHYESIRLGLLSDSMAGLSEHAKAIQDGLAPLLVRFDAAEAGVAAADADECRQLLPELSAAAMALAAAEGLDAAREAMFELSRPLGRYRKLAGIDGTVVAFCPMAKRAWIQPAGELGNPYMGQKMAACGSVIAD